MENLRSFVSLGIITGLSLAILANADKASKIVGSVSEAFFGLIQTSSGGTKKL